MDGQYAGNAPFSLPIKTPENTRPRFIFFRCMGFGVSDRLRGLEGPGGNRGVLDHFSTAHPLDGPVPFAQQPIERTGPAHVLAK